MGNLDTPILPFRMNGNDHLSKLVQMQMPFGKYQGRILCDLPMHYLEWYYTKGFPKGQLGELLHTLFEIKLNGLEYLLLPFKKQRR